MSESINFNYEEDYVYKKSLPYSFDVSSFEESNLYECDERHHEEDSRELPVLVNNRQSRQLTMTLEQDFSCNSPPIDSLYQ